MRADGVSAVRIASLAGVLLVFASVASGENAATPVDWARAERVDVRMLEYEFVPDQLRFRHDVPYRLHLINTSALPGHRMTPTSPPRDLINWYADYTGVYNPRTGSGAGVSPRAR